MDDTRDPRWKVVLRHDPCGMRTTEDGDVPFFGASSPTEGNFTIPPVNHGRGIAPQPNGLHRLPDGPLVQGDAIRFFDTNALIPDADALYDNMDHEDDMEDAFGDVLATPI